MGGEAVKRDGRWAATIRFRALKGPNFLAAFRSAFIARCLRRRGVVASQAVLQEAVIKA